MYAMKNISDIIEAHLKRSIQQSGAGMIEVQRSQLAELFQCVPSQINYVISTRFTVEKGYVVESKRGGGGYIRIKKVSIPESDELYYRRILELIKDQLSQAAAEDIIDQLLEEGKITSREASLMRIAIDREQLPFASSVRDSVRAKIMKNMLRVIFFERGT